MLLGRTENGALESITVKPVTAKTGYLFVPFLLFVTSIALLVRIKDLGYVAESLWAEDGLIFINQAYEFGIQSLLIPLNGQQFLYHRIVALLASQFPLVATPYIFFLAWLMSFFSIVSVLKSRMKVAGFDNLLTVCLVCAIALQPNQGESFFNLNHAHWFLGIALAFHICIPSQRPTSTLELLFLILASLTGPFSAFMSAILALQLAFLRDFSSRKATYIVVPICGLVQSIFILGSQRISHTAIDGSATHWLQVISSFVFFGTSDKLAYVAAAAFWSVILIAFSRWIAMHRKRTDRTLWLSPFFCAVTAILLFLMGALSMGTLLPSLSPLDLASRHFLIPYSLSFYIALACTRDHRIGQTAAISMISVICAAGFLTVDRPDRASTNGVLSHVNMQWTAFTKLQEIKPSIVIPVNPPWPIHPPLWRVELKKVGIADSVAAKAGKPILLSPQQSMSVAGSIDSDSTMSGSTMELSRALYLDIKNHCVTSNYLALEVDIWRSRMGWARVFWGQPGSFDSKRSLARFYPDGAAVMQFAFRRDASDYMIRFDPAQGVDESEIMSFFNVIREYLSRPGMFAAEPTTPGGETRIKEVRLFCLE